MIIKVMRTVDDWTMLEGIEQIQVNRIKGAEDESKRGCYDARIFKVVASVFDDRKPTDFYTQIVFQDKTGDWCTIAFNTEAFVCSDSGKTIERIYG